MGDLEERKRSQRLEQAIRNTITRLKEHGHQVQWANPNDVNKPKCTMAAILGGRS